MDTNKAVAGGHGTLLDGPHRLQVTEQCRSIAEALTQALNEFDYELLEAEMINQPLSFQTHISTIYRDPQAYLILDAIFYWED
ncbi:hypothetical protein G4V62_12015 [Bacillaceae bacterium SIJ1]|uniref:hypothetical protein n=1 Tax=Litoribacterium kuwaitense TaxID=1398745 RepID=UPI0013EDC2B4|nr:hypothetical protein [Litoribacterium kuwaitense]NGP45647.1 hypothetical protein [Litoribacterium kuwaitense]